MQDFVDTYIWTSTRLPSMIILAIIIAAYFTPQGKEKCNSFVRRVRAYILKTAPLVKEWWKKQIRLQHLVLILKNAMVQFIGGTFAASMTIPYIIFHLVYLPGKKKFDIPLKKFYSKFKIQLWWLLTAILALLWTVTFIIGFIVITDFLNYFVLIIVFFSKNLLLMAIGAIKKVMGVIFGNVLQQYPDFISWQKVFREETRAEFNQFVDGKRFEKEIRSNFKPVQFWFLSLYYILGL